MKNTFTKIYTMGKILRKNNIFVDGEVYGRNFLSDFFHENHAVLILKMIKVPLFIAHNKISTL